jgi:hypothetical protein
MLRPAKATRRTPTCRALHIAGKKIHGSTSLHDEDSYFDTFELGLVLFQVELGARSNLHQQDI